MLKQRVSPYELLYFKVLKKFTRIVKVWNVFPCDI